MRPPPLPCTRCAVVVARNCGLAVEKLELFKKCTVNVTAWYDGQAREGVLPEHAGGGIVPVLAGVGAGKTNLRPMSQCHVTLRKLQIIQIKSCRVMLQRKKLTQQIHSQPPLAQQSEVDLLQFHPQPRTVRQRVENCQLLSDYNLGYQDDVFDQFSPIVKKFSLLSSSSSSTLSEDSLSDTSSSSNGPMLAWPELRSSTPIKPSTPYSNLISFQHLAFVHKKIKEKKHISNFKKKMLKKRLEIIREKGSIENQFKNLQDVIALNLVRERSIGDDEGLGEEMESYFSDLGE